MRFLELREVSINPAQITAIEVATDGIHRSCIRVGDRRYSSSNTVQEITAAIESLDSPLEDAVHRMVEVNEKNQALLERANQRIRELNDKLALMESEVRGLVAFRGVIA